MERKITKAGVTSKPTTGLKKSGWRTLKVNYDYCKGCLICANVCSFKAVKNEMEK